MLPEVVILVLQHLYVGQRHAFLQCMRVSSSWHDLAVPILWRDIYLQSPPTMGDRSSPMYRFLESTTSAEHLHHVRSMTLKLPQPMSGDNLDCLIGEFAERLNQVGKLRSLSLFVHITTCFATKDTVVLMMQCLPPSIRDIELARAGRVLTPTGLAQTLDRVDKCSFLKTLGKTLPQLQRVRLCNVRLCPGTFTQIENPFPCLEELCINHGHDDTKCSCEVDQATWDAWPTSEKRRDRTINGMLSGAKSAIENNLLPRIQKFSIIGSTGVQQVQGPAFPCLYKADLMGQRVTRCPFQDTVPAANWARLPSRDGTDGHYDAMGLRERLMSGIEDMDWIEYNNRSRLHRKSAAPVHLLRVEEDADRLEDAISLAQKVRKYREKRITLYYWEAKLGRPLIHIETTEGLHVALTMNREQPLEELSPEPGSEVANDMEDLDEGIGTAY